MTANTITAGLNLLRRELDTMLANLRVELMTTAEGREALDTMPERYRRMLKHATWVL